MDRMQIVEQFQALQDDICRGLEILDGEGKFVQDQWHRPGGGGGRTRVINGVHIEKGGVNFSAVEGELSPMMAKSLEINDTQFFATGVSIVLHPTNPHVPIIHMNIRYFETSNTWWFGGGIDLTPHYIVDDQAKLFHQALKDTCDKHNMDFYPKFKIWADDYFYIPHRQETRGVGGIFFDKLREPEVTDKHAGFNFTLDVGKTFLPTYKALFRKNFELPFTDEERDWQLLRRGRYVEFNLVWDRGTKFGLMTDGRTESILMSLPQDARWLYDYKPTQGSRESETLSKLIKGVNWVK